MRNVTKTKCCRAKTGWHARGCKKGKELAERRGRALRTLIQAELRKTEYLPVMSYLEEILTNISAVENGGPRTMSDTEVMLASRRLILIMVAFFTKRDTLDTMYRKYCEFAHHPRI